MNRDSTQYCYNYSLKVYQVNETKNRRPAPLGIQFTEGSIRPFISLHQAGRRDHELLEELARLQDSIFRCRRHNRLSELIKIAARPENSALYLALHGRRVSGFILVRRSTRHSEWHVRGVGVHGPYRRMGIGTLLLREAMRLVSGIKGEALVSYVDRKNIPSLKLHMKAGFFVDRKSRPAATELRWRMVLP